MNDSNPLVRQPKVNPLSATEHDTSTVQDLRRSQAIDPVAAALWPSTNGSGPTFAGPPPGENVPLSRRAKKAPMPTRAPLARDAEAVQPWYSQFASPAIDEARSELQAAVEAATAAADARGALWGDEQAERGAAAAAPRSDASAVVTLPA